MKSLTGCRSGSREGLGAVPTAMAGRASGRATAKNTRMRLAPSVRDSTKKPAPSRCAAGCVAAVTTTGPERIELILDQPGIAVVAWIVRIVDGQLLEQVVDDHAERGAARGGGRGRAGAPPPPAPRYRRGPAVPPSLDRGARNHRVTVANAVAASPTAPATTKARPVPPTSTP